jgi:hypothetical protein
VRAVFSRAKTRELLAEQGVRANKGMIQTQTLTTGRGEIVFEFMSSY